MLPADAEDTHLLTPVAILAECLQGMESKAKILVCLLDEDTVSMETDTPACQHSLEKMQVWRVTENLGADREPILGWLILEGK